jgi:hypothetical protein
MAKKGQTRIPRPATAEQKPNKRQIPARASEASAYPEDPEDQTLQISFRFYSDAICQIDRLERAEARKAVKQLRQAGAGSAHTLGQRGIRTDPAPKELPGYDKYYARLTEDVDLLHTNLGSAARLFYLLEGTSFHVVSIRTSHDKMHRRN